MWFREKTNGIILAEICGKRLDSMLLRLKSRLYDGLRERHHCSGKHCYCKITQRAIERLLNYDSYIEAKLLDESEI